eukprot:5143198-Prorocentrum_lima.AAC.1
MATSSAPTTSPTAAELNMILKVLQSLALDSPRWELGDPTTRARRFCTWLSQVSQAVEPAGLSHQAMVDVDKYLSLIHI